MGIRFKRGSLMKETERNRAFSHENRHTLPRLPETPFSASRPVLASLLSDRAAKGRKKRVKTKEAVTGSI